MDNCAKETKGDNCKNADAQGI